ncbi:FxsA family protein [Bartonella tribocorum]|uniref:FxsA protein n=1 Tax=Bartonella tribocorum TaxID=85701 RepID=A0A2M6UXT1_9HYPH|nr:FxsA family protein [Bartonella tribocorum]PIT71013.1 FxsA protein [Bartonella tribocorum]
MIKLYSINPRFSVVILLCFLLIEIACFIFVGQEIGILATLSLVILTAIVGVVLLRIQGVSLLKNIQSELIQGRTLEKNILNDACIMLSAILLILPGFVSDLLGILLLIKPIRSGAWHFFSSLKTKMNPNTKRKNDSEKIIDLNAEDYKIHDTTESPWRKNDDNH